MASKQLHKSVRVVFFSLIWTTCMPSKAKMRMKRKRRKRRERMERMELRREMTRLRRLAQYFVTFNTNQVIFARISGHLEDPQEPECAENGETKLASLWPAVIIIAD